MKIIRFLLGTSIIWLPIIASIIAKAISQLITMDTIMTILYILAPILLIILLRINYLERKEMKKDVYKNSYGTKRKNITKR